MLIDAESERDWSLAGRRLAAEICWLDSCVSASEAAKSDRVSFRRNPGAAASSVPGGTQIDDAAAKPRNRPVL